MVLGSLCCVLVGLETYLYEKWNLAETLCFTRSIRKCKNYTWMRGYQTHYLYRLWIFFVSIYYAHNKIMAGLIKFWRHSTFPMSVTVESIYFNINREATWSERSFIFSVTKIYSWKFNPPEDDEKSFVKTYLYFSEFDFLSYFFISCRFCFWCFLKTVTSMLIIFFFWIKLMERAPTIVK